MNWMQSSQSLPSFGLSWYWTSAFASLPAAARTGTAIRGTSARATSSWSMRRRGFTLVDHGDLAVHLLVPGAAEDVAQEGERAGLGGHEAHARDFLGNDVGAQVEVRQVEAHQHVGRSELEDHRLALLEGQVAGRVVEALGLDLDHLLLRLGHDVGGRPAEGKDQSRRGDAQCSGVEVHGLTSSTRREIR